MQSKFVGPIYEGAPNLPQTRGGVFPEPRMVTEKGRIGFRSSETLPLRNLITPQFYVYFTPKRLAIAVLGFHYLPFHF